jgi:phospholipid/cholesterol/gamma-HCH transport system substrate-binding protein
MRIDPRDSSRVQVTADIDATTPISQNTVAELGLQGVTGLLYIDLAEDRSHHPAAAAVEGIRYPVIRSAPSRFDVVLASLPELLGAAGDMVQRANALLSDANLKAVTATLGHIDQASERLPQTVHDLNALIADLHGATAELNASARGAHELIDASGPDAELAVRRLRALSEHLSSASEQLDRMIAENRQDLRSFARDGLPEIERFAREGRAAAEDIRALAGSLRENPAQLLYQPPVRGVEIPR